MVIGWTRPPSATGTRGIASFVVTAGLTYTAAACTVLSGGSIEAHVHFFVIIGLIALYRNQSMLCRQRLDVLGHTVSDLTPVLAERTENAQRLGLHVVARLADAGSREHTSLLSCAAPRNGRLRYRPITSRRHPAVRGGAVPLPGQQASSPATDGRYPLGTLNRTERNQSHMMNVVGPVSGQLDWLLTDFMRGAPGVLHALVVSGDGLLLAASDRVDVVLGDQLSAATSGLVSLARGAAQLLNLAPVNQTIIEMTDGYLFMTSISQGSTLAVVTERQCDMGLMGYEMTMLASRVGHALTPVPRSAADRADRTRG